MWALAGLVACAAQAAEPLPPRDLLVGWRVVSAAQAAEALSANAGTVVQTGPRPATGQQVRVRNGESAKLYVGQNQSRTVWQWALYGGVTGAPGASAPTASAPTASMGVQLWPQTTVIELGQGVSVRPRWAGGQAPVRLTVQASVRRTPAGGLDPDGQPRQFEAASTLTLPLGQWTPVARSGGPIAAGPRHAAGTLATTDLDEAAGEQLEVRVTLP